MNLTFYIVDVFAEEKYAGNQLAVVRGGVGLPDERLQRIALEMNFSETTFLLSEEETEGGWELAHPENLAEGHRDLTGLQLQGDALGGAGE